MSPEPQPGPASGPAHRAVKRDAAPGDWGGHGACDGDRCRLASNRAWSGPNFLIGAQWANSMIGGLSVSALGDRKRGFLFAATGGYADSARWPAVDLARRADFTPGPARLDVRACSGKTWAPRRKRSTAGLQPATWKALYDRLRAGVRPCSSRTCRNRMNTGSAIPLFNARLVAGITDASAFGRPLAATGRSRIRGSDQPRETVCYARPWLNQVALPAGDPFLSAVGRPGPDWAGSMAI